MLCSLLKNVAEELPHGPLQEIARNRPIGSLGSLVNINISQCIVQQELTVTYLYLNFSILSLNRSHRVHIRHGL
jgi:hypothetical protein